MNNIDKIESFDVEEWRFERSPGYAGHRNINSGEWIYSDEFFNRDNLKREFDAKLSFLSKFRQECLPFGEYPDHVLLEFLNKWFDKQVK